MTKSGKTKVLLVTGQPKSGKTAFALRELLTGIDDVGQQRAFMAVSGRKVADALSDQVIRELGASAQVRPVTTLSAIAFRQISAARAQEGLAAPRLLNGAEQDALLRGVLAAHIRHVLAGESGECAVCGLLAEYFVSSSWPSLVMTQADWSDVLRMGDQASRSRSRSRSRAGDDAMLLQRGLSGAFVQQLRDMLARMNELGVSMSGENDALHALDVDRHPTARTMRLKVQWRLAFALRREYAAAIESTYAPECRLDSSLLLVEGMAAVDRLNDEALPRCVVVDDFQDVTLAGLAFLRALHRHGCHLVLVGNPDESVQAFRGSYPEYLFSQVRGWDGVEQRTLTRDRSSAPQAPSYLDLVASRVSLSIASVQDDDLPIVRRPGKLPAYRGSFPIAALDDADALPSDGSVTTGLYRSPREEIDDVVWRIKREHLGLNGSARRAWNDMAVIAHDNATVRAIGERLRREGVPVIYSSVTRPLKDEPFVQALFSTIELAGMMNRGLEACSMGLARAARYIRSRLADVMNSPLITVGANDRDEGYPARLSVAESAMDALQSLAGVVASDLVAASGVAEDATSAASSAASADVAAAASDASGTSASAALPRLVAAWRTLRAAVSDRRSRTAAERGIEVSDAILDDANAPADEGTLPFGRDAMYLLLVFDTSAADAVLASIRAVCGTRAGRADDQAEAFARAWNLVRDTAEGLSRISSRSPQYALSAAWKAAGVDKMWQRLALGNTAAGRAANDRLDVAMRLFQFAEDSTAASDITGFIDQVRAMDVEADSLAHVSPVEQAVTLATPAGAVGRHWPMVWIPAVQQDVWPNLAPRNTMFGGEDLADVMLRGRLLDDVPPAGGPSGGNPRLAGVLYAERKSLLVALTRATQTVVISAAANDETSPSDFLYGFLPERYRRDANHYTEAGDGGAYAGLDADPRGLVTAARLVLTRAAARQDAGRSPSEGGGTSWLDDVRVRDAADALALLAANSMTSADPRMWAFVGQSHNGVGRPAKDSTVPDASNEPPETNEPRTVTLSPSAVDGLWACPVCWLLEHRFAGPRPSSAAAGFGTIIHAVAEQASNDGLDLPGCTVDEIADRMMRIYQSMRPDIDSIDDVRERYEMQRRDDQAATMLTHIATYFVESNEPGYPERNANTITVGTLENSRCEVPFAARFDLRDITAAYNAIPDVDPISPSQLMAIMGALVGGWPEAMSETLTVRLSGRIDRVETRVTADGRRQYRLIDYKTGKRPSLSQIFSDLQLVCYQLGLVFPETGPRGGEAVRNAPDIAQSELFHVAEQAYPAESYAPESAYQPALFADGSLNAAAFTPRYHYKKAASLFDAAVLPSDPPRGVDDSVWQRFVALRGTQAVWALTMIARVFYAAAASISTRIEAHPQPYHTEHCRCIGRCPACSGVLDTVVETRQL